MSITRRSLLQGFGSIGLIALFRPKLFPDRLVEIEEGDILEEYYSNPSAIDMVVAAQMAFRPERIVIPQDIASLWIIENITIGGQPQFAGSGAAIPAEIFTPNAFDNRLYMDPMMPGLELKMRVRRSGLVKVGESPEVFRAAFFGHAVDGIGRKMVLPISSNPFQVCG